MGFLKKCGMCVCLFPLVLALVIIIINIGTKGFWPLLLLIPLLLALILIIPGVIMIVIGHNKDSKQKQREQEAPDVQFDSYLEEEAKKNRY